MPFLFLWLWMYNCCGDVYYTVVVLCHRVRVCSSFFSSYLSCNVGDGGVGVLVVAVAVDASLLWIYLLYFSSIVRLCPNGCCCRLSW